MVEARSVLVLSTYEVRSTCWKNILKVVHIYSFNRHRLQRVHVHICTGYYWLTSLILRVDLYIFLITVVPVFNRIV